MEEEGSLHYYLQDELGSLLRVSGYGAGKETADIRNEYLTYGYDEFGNDLYKELEDAGIPCPYDRQGEEQPFGYTGYRFDDVSGTYFAQAREYRAESGRFTAEDVIKGNCTAPSTLNQYIYCNDQPISYIDLNGKSPMIQYYGNQLIWDQFMNDINDTINAKKIKWSKSTNSVKEGWNNTINNIQTGLSDTFDSVRNSIGTQVEEIRDTLSKNNGILTVKASANANALLVSM
ncbi:MAG: hypothetical protein HDR23_04730 [Lachnospiraceae bacterium]|nr:hypothetical protein [Lachnospiraceae bacterium]